MHIKDYLNLKVEQYNNPSFIEDDPIKIPHLFKKKEDIEISGFLTSSIAWGNRKSIISNSKKMMQLLDNDPYNFVFNHSEKDLKNLLNFWKNISYILIILLLTPIVMLILSSFQNNIDTWLHLFDTKLSIYFSVSYTHLTLPTSAIV